MSVMTSIFVSLRRIEAKSNRSVYLIECHFTYQTGNLSNVTCLVLYFLLYAIL